MRQYFDEVPTCLDELVGLLPARQTGWNILEPGPWTDNSLVGHGIWMVVGENLGYF